MFNPIKFARNAAYRTSGKQRIISGIAKLRDKLWTNSATNAKVAPIVQSIKNKTNNIINSKQTEQVIASSKLSGAFKAIPDSVPIVKDSMHRHIELAKLSARSWYNTGNNKKIVLTAGIIGAGTLAYHAATNRPSPHKIFNSNDNGTIPNKYQRGYDTIKESLTDFGSPVHLDKTVMKTLTKYKSSIRRARVTSVDSVTNSNIALQMSKKAIGHTKYGCN